MGGSDLSKITEALGPNSKALKQHGRILHLKRLDVLETVSSSHERQESLESPSERTVTSDTHKSYTNGSQNYDQSTEPGT